MQLPRDWITQIITNIWFLLAQKSHFQVTLDVRKSGLIGQQHHNKFQGLKLSVQSQLVVLGLRVTCMSICLFVNTHIHILVQGNVITKKLTKSKVLHWTTTSSNMFNYLFIIYNKNCYNKMHLHEHKHVVCLCDPKLHCFGPML